ncbi:MAG TPA: sensor histidine kinase, partial [Spirochaetota bacterium]|nr:sensor histidine kinase [Spirochaetota bacterium]
MVALDGEWEFHWRKLLSPSDFSGPRPPAPDAYLSVPGIWNGTLIGGAAIDGRGYATYRLKVRLGGATGDLGFKLLDAATAYRMWVNGVPVASNGAV